MSKKKRMSSVLNDLSSRNCFATDAGWQEYQDVVAKLKMQALEQQMLGEEIRPAHGFNARKPSRRRTHGTSRITA